ncbi:MAG: hypothetical protein LBC05_02505 [Endomicrobium sp.]|jgi:hypothetical protein|nr:hypothetical protein [Endomicrobium sp.]
MFADMFHIIDTPSSEMLNYGSYSVEFGFFSNGGSISQIDFGFSKFLNIGLSLGLDQFIGNKQLKVTTPAFKAKLKIYDGDMKLPMALIGFDGQDYFLSFKKRKYFQKGRGLYFVIGKELFLENLMFNIGINANIISKPKFYGFLNATAPIYKEMTYLMIEYDNINYCKDARLNLGLRFTLMKCMDIDYIIRNCCRGKDKNLNISNEKILKVRHFLKF